MEDLERYEKIYSSQKAYKTRFTILEYYTFYIHDQYIKEILKLSKNLRYLDLASGQAKYSDDVTEHFNQVIFSEITNSGITFMKNKYKNKKNISVKKIDISNFTLEEKAEIITMASSLSYVNIKVFLKNISSNLSKNGYFIFLDTLNNNFIYKFYRYLLNIVNPNYRSKKILKQLINKKSLEIIKSNFKQSRFKFYGNSIMFIFLISKIFPIKIRKNQIIYPFFKFLDKFFSFLPPYKVVGICKDLKL